MSDNTLQYRWIVTVKENIDAMIPDFVAGDLLWYPVRGDNRIRAAPDVLVAIGRPKGERSSYLQWQEDDIPPQVVFEILSPSNTFAEMQRKRDFYDHYGVEEYYLYDPDNVRLLGWIRGSGGGLVEILRMHQWVSPRLAIRFDLSGTELIIYRPDGAPFLTAQQMLQRAEEMSQRAEEMSQRAEEMSQQAVAAQQERDRERAQRLMLEQELAMLRAALAGRDG